MRYLRLILIILLAFALITLALVAGVYAYVTPERVTERISTALRRDFGVTAELAGNVTLRRLPRMEITLPKTTLHFEQSTVSTTIDSALIVMNPLAFLAQSPRVDEVVLNGLRLNTNKANLAALIERAQPAKNRMFSIDKLTVRDSTLRILATDSIPVALENFGISFAEITDIGGSATLVSLASTPEFSGKVTARFSADWSRGLSALALSDAAVTLHGLYRGSETQIDLSAEHAAFGAVQELRNTSLSVKRHDGFSADLSAHSVTVSDKLLIPAFRSEIGFPTDDGQQYFTVEMPVDLDRISGELKRSVVRIEAALLRTTEANAQPVPNGSMSGEIAWHTTEGTARMDLEGIFRDTPVSAHLTAENTAPIFKPGQLLPDTFVARPKISGELNLGQLSPLLSTTLLNTVQGADSYDYEVRFAMAPSFRLLPITTVRGLLTSKGGQMAVTQGTAVLAGSEVPYSATLSPDGKWRAESRFDRISSASALMPAASGTVSGILTAEGMLTQPEKLSVTADLTLANGRLFGTSLEALALIMEKEQPERLPVEAFHKDTVTAFDTMNIKTSYGNGLWQQSTVTAQGYGWQADFSGERGLLAGTIRFTDTLGNAFFTLPAAVKLQKDHPVWTADWQAGLASARQNAGELPMNFNRFKDKVGRELRHWWDNLDIENFELPKIEMPEIELPKLPKFEMPEMELPKFDIPEWVPFVDHKQKAQDPV